MFEETTFWIVFVIIAAIIIVIDLYVTEHRQDKIGLKKSIIWSGVWITTALLFDLLIHFYLKDGGKKGLEFITGYLIEYSLSVDNLFVFLLIFNVMNISPEHQPHVLKWGILSAIVFRILFILAGVELINMFQPITYLFGFILFVAAYKMAFGGKEKINYEKNPFIKIIKKFFNIIPDYKGKKFFVRKNKKIFATSMLLTLLLIETSDIVFAVDSIPAVIAITRDPFVIITSNIFAVLGLRALYFSISGIVDMFYFLKYGVAVILLFVGLKMISSEFFNISTQISLIIILSCLALSIIFSLVYKKPNA